ncbi:MAG: hypothetical protein IPF98_08770 [Gemmatimonadetes bacterium]|nr:hypothetical protein [Gemmatimonadota bacterium]MCC6774010.1 hypothetical protein [Gemmatimonadaceae bacterium]
MGIEFLNPRSAADVDRVATLYEENLADSPVVLLGPRFLREFFFKKLVESDLLGCLVCRVDGTVIGFLSWTNHPGDFIGRGIKKHFVGLSWIMLKGIVEKPSTIKQILSALKIVGKRSEDAGKEHDPKAIEAISLVVPPEFQKHVPEGGKARTTVRLVQDLAAHARTQGTERVLYVVQPRNKASSIFFAVMGCELNKRTYAGEEVYVYTHHLVERPEDA